MVLRAWLVLALCVGLAAGPAWTDTAEVAATNANLRSAPGTNSPVVATLVRGARLEVLDVSGDWLKVRVVETKAIGWIHRRLVEVLPAPVAVAPSAGGATVSIEHRDVGCIVAGHYPKLEACFSPDARVGRGRVLFRAAGSDPWYYVDMSRDGPCYSAVLPKPKPELKGFEYFVDVIDKAFAEAHKPERAPEQAFTPRVVKKQDDCDPARKMALFLPRLVKPIVVGIARSPAGSVLSAVAAKALESHALLTGFSSEGVIVSSTGAAPAAASGSSTSSGTSATAHAGGGLPKIAIVGGVVAAGVLVAVAAGGGGGDSGSAAGGSGSGGSGGSAPGGGSGTSIAGQWTGNSASGNGLTFQFGSEGISCSSKYDIAANFTQSGGAVGGNMTYSGRSFTCTASDPELQQILNTALLPGDSGGFPLSGTATDTNVTLTISTITFTGTYNRTTMDLNGNLGSNLGLPYTMTLKLVRQ
jgi:hypothetical protein